MKTIFTNVILNCATSAEESPLGGVQDLNIKGTRCRNKFGMTNRMTSGFTLIELLVTIAIIGILSSFLLANFIGVRQRARDGIRKSDLRQIQAALELYRSDQTAYPPSISSCGGPITGGSPAVTYMAKIPCDPSNTTPATSYRYNSSAAETAYCLRTCLENTNDGDRDYIKYGSDNPTISGCTLSACSSGKSYTLQSP